MPKLTIGLLEDEKPQAALLQGWLNEAGYDVLHHETGRSFIKAVKQQPPDILVLDWQLPDCEGIDVLKKVRNNLAFEGPILFCTAKNNEEDVVNGLTSGADDYLIKPVRQAELLARLAALWRRVRPSEGTSLTLGNVELDMSNQFALVCEEKVHLTPTEFQLATCLFENVGKLLSREYLLRKVWGVGADIDTRTVDVHISRIRKLLKISPDMGYCIKTIYRHGYRLEAL